MARSPKLQLHLYNDYRYAGWATAYTFHILVITGFIIASAITLRFGDNFFSDPNISSGNGNSDSNSAMPFYADGPCALAPEGSGSDESGAAATTGPTSQQCLTWQTGKRNALIQCGVISSVAIALCSINLILNFASVIVQLWLSTRKTDWEKKEIVKQRGVAVVLICIVNILMTVGSIALAWGFSFTSRAVSRYTLQAQASTTAYLVGCAVMAALTAGTAVGTVIMDLERQRKAKDELIQLEKPQLGSGENGMRRGGTGDESNRTMSA